MNADLFHLESGCTLEPYEFEHEGVTVRAVLKPDDAAGTPWEREDGHGPVTDWTTRAKRPGEFTLSGERRGSSRFYDFAEACKIARRDGWGCKSPEGLTRRQRAAMAAAEDFQRLKDWCDDRWHYVGVVVTVSRDGVELAEESLWGIESDAGAYLNETAAELLAQALSEARTRAAALVASLSTVNA